MSPILTGFYSHHANHFHLVTQEPVLCTIILTISSRYHVLPGYGATSRGYLIHERLWNHCQHLLLRIVLGQEKGSKGKTRSLGTVEALLLLTEWHPRALHFPPPNDGWDSDLLFTVADGRDEIPRAPDTARGRWLVDVIDPAKRSDHMAWMLVGCAVSLAHELGVFDGHDSEHSHTQPEHVPGERRRNEQRVRLRRLLYVYIEQLSLRLGCRSITPQSLNHAITDRRASATTSTDHSVYWQTFIDAWIELTKLVKSASDTLFPSPSLTASLLNSGRYVNMIEHFQPLLSAWRDRNLSVSSKFASHQKSFYFPYSLLGELADGQQLTHP